MDLRASLRLLPALAVQFLAAVVVAFLGLGLLAEKYWLFDLLTHFRWQYSIILLACGVALLGLSRRKSALLSLAAGSALLFTLLPSAPAPVTPTAPVLKVISFNVLKNTNNRDQICEFLEAENADVVVLSEITGIWDDHLVRLQKRYPYLLGEEKRVYNDVVILSRHPFLSTDAKGFRKRRWTEAVVAIEGVPYRIAAAHTSPPTSASNSQARNRQLLGLADHLAGSPRTILCGDLNITPFSPWFAAFRDRSGLIDSSHGAGFSPTWMATLPVIAVPIDHVLFSRDLSLISRRVGPSLGSDHSPVIVEIAPAPSLVIR